MSRKDIKPDEVPHKGYDFPKNEIPEKLYPKGKEKQPKEGATIFDYLKHGWDKLRNLVIGVSRFVSDIKTISIQANTMLYVLIVAFVLLIIISLIT